MNQLILHRGGQRDSPGLGIKIKNSHFAASLTQKKKRAKRHLDLDVMGLAGEIALLPA